MKKDIYIIENSINKKVYIGQSVDVAHRWEQHLSESRTTRKSLISRAINKHGYDKFFYRILESQIENFDEREQYWIREYSSLTPNGYNISSGGAGIGTGIDHPNSNFKTAEELESLLKDIIENKISFAAISKKYGTTSSTVSSINLGKAYFNENLDYPLRVSRFTKEKIDQITYSLKYECDKTFSQISKEYQIDKSYLFDINKGESHHRSYLKYPLREKNAWRSLNDIYKLIIQDLKGASPQKEIAKKYNISVNAVTAINLGRQYFDENESYPIRKNPQNTGKSRKSISPNELKEIERLLRETTLSVQKISERFEISAGTVRNINNGQVKKYYSPTIKYPIRRPK